MWQRMSYPPSCSRVLVLVTTLLGSASAAAQDYYPEQRFFDKPETVVAKDAKDGPHPVVAMRCTYFADMVVRETETDSPAFGPAFLMARLPGTAPPACSGGTGLRETRLNVSSQGLIGRRGGFLFFSSTEAPASEPFEIIRIRDGRSLYKDTRLAEHMKSVVADGDTLKLTYVRAVDGPCSIPKDGVVCWARIVKQSRFVGAIASQPAPIAACAASYRSSKTELDDPSMVTYDVSLVIGADGKPAILSRGSIGCEPMP